MLIFSLGPGFVIDPNYVNQAEAAKAAGVSLPFLLIDEFAHLTFFAESCVWLCALLLRSRINQRDLQQRHQVLQLVRHRRHLCR